MLWWSDKFVKTCVQMIICKFVDGNITMLQVNTKALSNKITTKNITCDDGIKLLQSKEWLSNWNTTDATMQWIVVALLTYTWDNSKLEYNYINNMKI